jgi:hypothetical protein
MSFCENGPEQAWDARFRPSAWLKSGKIGNQHGRVTRKTGHKTQNLFHAKAPRKTWLESQKQPGNH